MVQIVLAPYSAGYNAALNGKSRNDNPYHYGLQRRNYELWNFGWLDGYDEFTKVLED